MSSQQPPKKKSKQVENKQGTVLSWVKPCTSDTEPCVVEETIRIKEQPESNCLANFPRTISQTSSLFRQSQHKRKIRDKNKRYCRQMKWSDVYQEVCFNRETEAGGGVNVGHSLSPPQSFYACYGPGYPNIRIEQSLVFLCKGYSLWYFYLRNNQALSFYEFKWKNHCTSPVPERKWAREWNDKRASDRNTRFWICSFESAKGEELPSSTTELLN